MDLVTRGGAARAANMRAATSTPDDPALVARAFRTVLAYTITDAFACSVEESLWVRHHLNEIVEPLTTIKAHTMPLSVRRELMERSYSDLFDRADTADGSAIALPADANTTNASLDDWTGALSETITQCYSLRPMTESAIYGQINGLLREIGVGDPVNPRGARYLPAAIRARLPRA